MKAILFKRYGPPEEALQMEEIKKPSPKDGQVLIKIFATTVTSGVGIIRKADFFLVRLINGPFKPILWKILGIEFSGVIEEVGKKVTLFKKGDEVFGTAGLGLGSYAEYKCINKRKAIVLKPSNLSWEEAAGLPVGAYTALYYLRDKANVKHGQKILIYGASGSVGTYAVQLAKYYKAEVTGVCSTHNVEMVKSIGADKVIDYKLENPFEKEMAFDVIFDAVGKTTYNQWKARLASGGKFLSVNKGMARGKPENLHFIKELAEKGYIKPVIDRVYKFEETAEAHRYVEQGHKKGNVVIKIVEDS